MNSAQRREYIKVYQGISKNLKKKTWHCLFEACNQSSINSHLLQQNGILNIISEDGHLIELRATDIFRRTTISSIVNFQRVGIKSALSYNVFCKQHDSEIFKLAENQPVDYEDYRVHILLSYRDICAEIRKKEQSIELQTRMLNSNSINKFISRENFELFIEGSRRGIEDLTFYKIKFEREFKVPNYEFEFKYFTYPLIKVYGSASFTIYEDIRTPFEERPLKYVFIHLIPRADSLKIIVGYNKHLSKKSIADFVSSWDGLSKTELELKLTNSMARA